MTGFCFRTALEVEEIVRSRDVVPATIGVLEGKIRVGKYGFVEERERFGSGNIVFLQGCLHHS